MVYYSGVIVARVRDLALPTTIEGEHLRIPLRDVKPLTLQNAAQKFATQSSQEDNLANRRSCCGDNGKPDGSFFWSDSRRNQGSGSVSLSIEVTFVQWQIGMYRFFREFQIIYLQDVSL